MFPSSSQLGMKQEPALAVEVRVAATPIAKGSVSSSKDEEARWLIFMFPSSQLGMKRELAPAVEVRVAATPAVMDSVSSSGEEQARKWIFVFPGSA